MASLSPGSGGAQRVYPPRRLMSSTRSRRARRERDAHALLSAWQARGGAPGLHSAQARERVREESMTTTVRDALAEAYDTHPEQAALRHVWIHQAAWRQLAEERGLRVLARGEGIYLYDVHGRRFI